MNNIKIIDNGNIEYMDKSFKLIKRNNVLLKMNLFPFIMNFNFDDVYYALYEPIPTGDIQYIMIIDNRIGAYKYKNDINTLNDGSLDFFIMVLELKNNLVSHVTLNGKSVVINPTIDEYPFMIFAPEMTTNYVIEENGNYKLFILSSNSIGRDCSEDLFGSYPRDPYYVTLEIKDNMFLPNISKTQHNILNTIYSNFGAHPLICNYFNIDKTCGYLYSGEKRREYIKPIFAKSILDKLKTVTPHNEELPYKYNFLDPSDASQTFDSSRTYNASINIEYTENLKTCLKTYLKTYSKSIHYKKRIV
jgi:hypothetical protein